MKKKAKGGGDCQMTGGYMKGKSCEAGVARAKRRAVRSFPVGFTFSRKTAKGK